MFTVILGDVEVYELCHWALMNRSFGSGCDGYKGGYLSSLYFLVSLLVSCVSSIFSLVLFWGIGHGNM